MIHPNHLTETSIELFRLSGAWEPLSAAFAAVSISLSFQLLGVLVGLVLAGVGVVLGWRGVSSYRYGRAIAEATPLDDPTSSGSLVSVEGTVIEPADGDLLDSRYGGTPCVAYSAKKIKKSSYSNQPINPNQESTYRERVREKTGSVPFELDSNDQPVRVEATDARVEVSNDDYYEVSARQVMENRGTLQGLFHLLVAVSNLVDRDRHQEYLEACIRPGDPVRVIGTSGTGRDGSMNLERDGTRIMITTKPQSRLVDGLLGHGKAGLFRGVALFAIGGFVILALAGVI